MTQPVTLLPNGRQQFFNGNGSPLVGGTVGMYIPSTLTPKITYTDSSGLVPNINPIVLDSIGSAAIWGSGLYRQIVKDNLSNVIWDDNTFAPQSGFASGVLYFDTVAAAQAATIALATTYLIVGGYYSSGDGGGGTYTLTTAGAGAGKFQSADGQWWILSVKDSVNVLQLGAKGDNSTLNATAFNNCVSLLPSTGGRVYIPAGTYLVESAITVNKSIVFYGDGGASGTLGASKILTTSTTFDIFTFTVAGSVVEDLYIGVSGITRSFGAKSVNISGGGGSAKLLMMNRCTIDNAATGLFCNSGGDGWVWLNEVEIDVLSSSSGKGIVMQNNSVPMFNGVLVASIGLPYPANQATVGMDLSECSYGFIDNSTVLCCNSGILIQGTGAVTVSSNLYFSNVGCDHCAVGWAFTANSGFTIGNIYMSQCSGTSASINGSTITANAGGAIHEISILGGSWALNGNSGILLAGATQGVTITNAIFLNNTGSDISITNTVQRVVISENQIGLGAFPSGTGVFISGTADYINVNNNIFATAFTTIAVNNGSSGTHIDFKDNIGLVTTGTSAIAVGASPYTYTAGLSQEVVYVSGGTVSEIDVEGVSTGLTSGTFILPSQKTLIVTYTGLPTMKKTILG